MTAVEYFVRGLKQRGVRWVATLCGHGLDPFYQAAQRAGLRLIDVRNEQTAGYMAGSAGRLTRRPGVAAVSSGVAHVNALSGVADAYMDGAPMLLVSGAAAVRTQRNGSLPGSRSGGAGGAGDGYARAVDCPERVLEILDAAWRAAGRTGSGHITFPMDVQTAEVRAERLAACPARPPRRCREGDPEAAAEALARAQQPLVVAGNGVYYAGGSEALVEFCERFAVPFVIPIWDRGCADRPLESFMGVIGAATGGPRLLAEADCVVMAGAAADYRVGYLQPGAGERQAAVLWHTSRLGRALAPSYEQRAVERTREWLEEAAPAAGTFSVTPCGSAAEQQSAGRTHADSHHPRPARDAVRQRDPVD
jgi:acetolactate synthase-1/2/3 large subunit